MLSKKNKQEKKDEIQSKFNAATHYIFFRSLSQAQIAYAHRAIAMFVYMTNLSFNYFENAYVIAHHQTLFSNYKFSNHKLITEKLLNEIYETVKIKINQMLKNCNYLSFFIDEIINIRKKRVINLCCHVLNERSFYLKTMIEIAEKMNAVVQVE